MFTGKATRIQFLEPDEEGREPKILVTFEVYEVWKGPVQRVLHLRTTYNKWTCGGYYFKEGLSYLVTAHEAKAANGETELAKVNICGGTRELARAQDVLRTLGPGKVPVEKPES
jgi:hypothetical protein